MRDQADALLRALGPGWVIRFDRSRRDRGEYGWELGKGWNVFCRAGTKDGLVGSFATARDRFPGGVRERFLDLFGIPKFLRCSSEEELLLKLEILNMSEKAS